MTSSVDFDIIFVVFKFICSVYCIFFFTFCTMNIVDGCFFWSAVTSVKSARQVIDALNAEGPDIDIILAEIDLPMAKGMKMLRYITRDKDLRRIPVISKLCTLSVSA